MRRLLGRLSFVGNAFACGGLQVRRFDDEGCEAAQWRLFTANTFPAGTRECVGCIDPRSEYLIYIFTSKAEAFTRILGGHLCDAACRSSRPRGVIGLRKKSRGSP